MIYMEQIKLLNDLEGVIKKGWRLEVPRYENDGFSVRFLMGGKEVLGFGQLSLYYALLDGLSKIENIKVKK